MRALIEGPFYSPFNQISDKCFWTSASRDLTTEINSNGDVFDTFRGILISYSRMFAVVHIVRKFNIREFSLILL